MTGLHTSSLSSQFHSGASHPTKQPKKRLPPVSVRFDADERAWLENQAAGQSLSGFIRDRVLRGATSKRRKRNAEASRDYEALGRLLGMLGRSKIGSALGGILLAVELGRLELDTDVECELKQACDDIAYMRSELITALGLQSEGR